MIFCNVSLFFSFGNCTSALGICSISFMNTEAVNLFDIFFLLRLSLLSGNYFLCLEKLTVSFINTLLFSRWKHFLLLIIWWNHILFHVITFHVIPLESLIAFSNHCSPSPSSASLLFLVLLAHSYFLFFFFFNATSVHLMPSTLSELTKSCLQSCGFSTLCHSDLFIPQNFIAFECKHRFFFNHLSSLAVWSKPLLLKSFSLIEIFCSW